MPIKKTQQKKSENTHKIRQRQRKNTKQRKKILFLATFLGMTGIFLVYQQIILLEMLFGIQNKKYLFALNQHDPEFQFEISKDKNKKENLVSFVFPGIYPGTNRAFKIHLKDNSVLLCNIALGYSKNNSALQIELMDKIHQLWDRLQFLLSLKYSNEINSSFKRQNVLKKELKHAMNLLLEHGKISEIYFSNFIIRPATTKTANQ